jgi:hypothetical protein
LECFFSDAWNEANFCKYFISWNEMKRARALSEST